MQLDRGKEGVVQAAHDERRVGEFSVRRDRAAGGALHGIPAQIDPAIVQEWRTNAATVLDEAQAELVRRARGILSLTLSPADRERMNELAAKARDGSLGADEQLEIESYRQACRLLDLMKAKARVSLKNAGETAA